MPTTKLTLAKLESPLLTTCDDLRGKRVLADLRRW